MNRTRQAVRWLCAAAWLAPAACTGSGPAGSSTADTATAGSDGPRNESGSDATSSSAAHQPGNQTPATACNKGTFHPTEASADPQLAMLGLSTVVVDSPQALAELRDYAAIDGALVVQDLSSTVGLECLTSVSALIIPENVTPDLAGLSKLTTIETLFMYSGGDVSQLASLETIGGDFQLAGGIASTLGGLPALRTIGGSWRSTNQQNLDSLGAYPNLQSIGGDLHLSAARHMMTLGEFAPGLTVGGNIRFENCAPMSMAGFEWLTHAQGNLEIEGLPADLAGLANLRAVDGDLILYNGALSSLHGLEQLETVGGELVVHNTQLCDFDPLGSLQSVGALTVDLNLQLYYPVPYALEARLGTPCNCTDNQGKADCAGSYDFFSDAVCDVDQSDACLACAAAQACNELVGCVQSMAPHTVEACVATALACDPATSPGQCALAGLSMQLQACPACAR